MVDKYLDHSWKIATYFTILHRPLKMTTKEFNAFKKNATQFKVKDNHLICRNSKNVLIRYDIDNLKECQTILQQLQNESGHKRRESIYR